MHKYFSIPITKIYQTLQKDIVITSDNSQNLIIYHQ